MEKDTPIDLLSPFQGEDWFDPLETAVRHRIRGFIEEMLEAELEAALHRPRYSTSRRRGTATAMVTARCWARSGRSASRCRAPE